MHSHINIFPILFSRRDTALITGAIKGKQRWGWEWLLTFPEASALSSLSLKANRAMCSSRVTHQSSMSVQFGEVEEVFVPKLQWGCLRSVGSLLSRNECSHVPVLEVRCRQLSLQNSQCGEKGVIIRWFYQTWENGGNKDVQTAEPSQKHEEVSWRICETGEIERWTVCKPSQAATMLWVAFWTICASSLGEVKR